MCAEGDCARWQRGSHPVPIPTPLLGPQPPTRPQPQMSLSHSTLLFRPIASASASPSPRKSNQSQVGRVKNQCLVESPRRKLIGSPAKFFNHNRLSHPPARSVVCQAPGWLPGRGEERSGRLPRAAAEAGSGLSGLGKGWRGGGGGGGVEARNHRLGMECSSKTSRWLPPVSHFAFESLSLPFWKMGI